MNDDKSLKLLGCFALLALVPVNIALKALALRDLWAWFVVPLGLPKIGLLHAAGIALVVSFLTFQYPPHKDDRDKDEKIAGAVFIPIIILISWGMGWIIARLGGFV